uniref:Uncharacterized protein n=1 Tax=Octopus bimaculoides TaxID=37653 RepID=A0A0L8HE88_OCTBM
MIIKCVLLGGPICLIYNLLQICGLVSVNIFCCYHCRLQFIIHSFTSTPPHVQPLCE